MKIYHDMSYRLQILPQNTGNIYILKKHDTEINHKINIQQNYQDKLININKDYILERNASFSTNDIYKYFYVIIR